MKIHSHKQIINLVIIVVPIAVVLSTLFLRPRFEIDSFEKCVAQKDSMMMLTYPGQCITRDGKKFVEPIDIGLEPEPIPEDFRTTPPVLMRNYENCVDQGGAIMESYPEQCSYPNGDTYTREIDEEEITEPSDEMTFEDTYTCPENGWVNCMPILTEEASRMCTPEYEEWAYANCPNFEGFAY